MKDADKFQVVQCAPTSKRGRTPQGQKNKQNQNKITPVLTLHYIISDIDPVGRTPIKTSIKA